MSSVYLSQQAVDDLKNIFSALITWQKGALELEHALQYVDDIEAKCYSLAKKNLSFPNIIFNA